MADPTTPPLDEEASALDAEEVEIPGEVSDVEETEDGGAIVTLDGSEPDADENPEFYGNLAATLDERVLDGIAIDLIDRIELDKGARKKRDKDYSDFLERTGLDGEPKGGADFQGASKVVHPMMVEASIDYAATVIKELWPIGGPDDEAGPVKDGIIGTVTQAKAEKARRKAKFLNWQMTKQMPGLRTEFEQMQSQVPMAGAQYLELTWDKRRKRPVQIFVPIDKVHYPYNAASFRSAERITHEQDLTEIEWKRRVASKMYIDLPLLPPSQQPEPSQSQQASDRIEGKEDPGENIDGVRIVYETLCFLEIAEDPETGGEIAPYLVSIDEDSRKIVGLYRYWFDDDEHREPLKYLVEFGLIPWRGTMLGLHHLQGGLAIAATGALRALLDSAHQNNMPGGVRLKGGMATKAKSISSKPCEWQEIEPPTTDQAPDIRKYMMPFPNNAPSPVLFSLLGFLTESARGLVRTTFDISEQNPNIPVGTMMAGIEQGLKVFSAIHARQHGSLAEVIEYLHQLNRLHLEDEVTIAELGELIAKRSDFEGPVDTVPVSDPRIFSEPQRQARLMGLVQRATGNPLYDPHEVETEYVKGLGYTDGKRFLIKKPEPKRLNLINEHVAASHGQPIVAFPDQNHVAHLRAHMRYLSSPMFGMNKLIAPAFIPSMLDHIKQHLVYWYVDSVVKLATKAAGVPIHELMDDDPEVEGAFDGMLADFSDAMLTRGPEMFKQYFAAHQMEFEPVIEQAMALMQELQPPQPMDPTAVAAQQVQIEGQKATAKAQADQAKAANDAQQLALDAQQQQTDAAREERIAQNQAENEKREQAIDMRRLLQDARDAALDRQSDERQNTADNVTALTIAAGEMEMGERVAIQNGGGIDPGNM